MNFEKEEINVIIYEIGIIKEGVIMDNELLVKQHLEYAKNHLKLYLDNIDELNDKINKAQKEYEKKKDEKSLNKLNEYLHERHTLEYLFKYECFCVKTITKQDYIKKECETLYHQFSIKADYQEKIIEENKTVLKNPKKIKNKKRMGQLIKTTLSDYVVLDLETTGLSFKDDEIIEVGLLKVRDNEIVEKYEQLIHPKKRISQTITRLTGITNEMVKESPTIDEVKNQIKELVGNDVILGHNVTFDIGFLKSLDRYFDNDYLDTLHFSRRAFYGIENYQLTTLVQTFYLINNEHRALADCLATKALYDFIVDKFNGIENLYKNDRNSRQNQLDVHILKKVHIDQDNKLKGKNCIITGNLSKMSKKTGNEIVLLCGGILQKSVNKKVDIVIVGMNPYSDNKTAKYLKAEELIEKGQNIEFIFENDFYKIIGLM